MDPRSVRVAIVAGGNGLLGRNLVVQLINFGIYVVVLGSKSGLNPKLQSVSNSTYFLFYQSTNNLRWEEVTLERLQNANKCEGIVFFNLAWRGQEFLTDGSLEKQLSNVIQSERFIAFAKAIDALNFVDIGSMEEIVLARYISSKDWATNLKNTSHPCAKNYALAKQIQANFNAFDCYCKKIDYVRALISIVVDTSLSSNKYVENCLKSILSGKQIIRPKNNELMNIVSAETLSRQLIALAQSGKNNKIYVLGTGEADSLTGFFNRVCGNKNILDVQPAPKISSSHYLTNTDFSIRSLIMDTSYHLDETFDTLINELKAWQKKQL